MYGGGSGWAAPPQVHGYVPSGWPQPVDQFHQQPIHGRQGDPRTLRQKEEQRRRQLEYSQALAEQVRQREQQKLVEKEARRREDAAFEASMGVVAHGGGRGGEPPRGDRGLFDGLGEHNPSQRGNFGRGRREPTLQAPGVNSMAMQPPIHHHTGIEVIPPYHQVQGGWSGHAEALGFVEPLPQQNEYMGATGPRQEAQWHAGVGQPQAPPPHVQQQPQHGGGRRIRTDLHGVENDSQARQRQQQQLDMQESLRRQIEEKQRQKLEEKRKREEEERREMEKFELEKRRQHEEQERIKEEKRRKALADEEHFRIQQQQLEAANAAAAAHDQRHHHRHREPPTQSDRSPPRVHHAPPLNKPPAMEKNPFTNSRDHLFEDPPSPPRQPVAVHQQVLRQQHSSYPDHGLHNMPPPPVHHTLDTQRLMEQYEQVRVELERQRQLVEQLHWQIQQQQQSRPPQAENPRDLPTISDLERLRQELREELEQREAQHRDELEALRREQAKSLSKTSSVSLDDVQPSPPRSRPAPRETEKPKGPSYRGRGRRHDAFVQEALVEESDGDEADADGPSNQRLSSEAPQLQPNNPVPKRGAHAGSRPALNASLSASSLHCDSKLVFFDGRVQQPNARSHPEILRRTITRELLEEEQPETEDGTRLNDSDSQDRPRDLHVPLVSHHTMAAESNQIEHLPEPRNSRPRKIGGKGDEECDALGFFVKRIAPIDTVSERYGVRNTPSISTLSRSSSTASISTKKTIHDRVQALLHDIDDDEEDGESLDGETLEAIFQRNVRRYEILRGFESNGQREPKAWEELGRQLQKLPSEVPVRRRVAPPEPSLVASSRWMLSSPR